MNDIGMDNFSVEMNKDGTCCVIHPFDLPETHGAWTHVSVIKNRTGRWHSRITRDESNNWFKFHHKPMRRKVAGCRKSLIRW